MKEQWQRNRMVRELPGPAIGTDEHWVFGPIGEVILKDNESISTDFFSTDFLSEVMVTRLQELSRKYRDSYDLMRIFAMNSVIPSYVTDFEYLE